MAAVGVWWKEHDVPLWAVLGLAAALRLAAFPLGPSLSDDGYRYVWDGLVQQVGVNPYERLPTDPTLGAVAERVPLDLLNSAPFYSVYPPASQLTFRVAAALAGPQADWLHVWRVLKGLMLGFEGIALGLLCRLAPPRAVVLYAWHPLPVLEIAGQGHTEAAMLPALLATVLLLRSASPKRGAQFGAGAALAWATSVKLVPALLAPLVLRKAGGWGMAGGVVLGVLFALPYAAPYVLPNVRSSLDLYVAYFEFNAGPYYLLKEVGRWWTGGDVSKVLGPALRSVFLGGIPVLAVLAWRFRWSVPGALLIGWSWFLVTSTTVHPWYLLAPLALLPLVVGGQSVRFRGVARLQVVAWAALTVGASFTYTLYGGGIRTYWFAVIASWIIWILLQLSPIAMRALPRLMRRRARRKWAWIDQQLGRTLRGLRVLDVGAGEGFVGLAAQQASGAEVVLCDVADFNQTPLPLALSDGRILPFASQSADLLLLVFVLHHAEDAEQLLAEAFRVLRPGGQVAVMESVAESARDQWLLHLLDPIANRIRSGGLMAAQEEHLRFRSAAAWREGFVACGFQVVSEERRGQVLHKQHLFILSKRGGRAHRCN